MQKLLRLDFPAIYAFIERILFQLHFSLSLSPSFLAEVAYCRAAHLISLSFLNAYNKRHKFET